MRVACSGADSKHCLSGPRPGVGGQDGSQGQGSCGGPLGQLVLLPHEAASTLGPQAADSPAWEGLWAWSKPCTGASQKPRVSGSPLPGLPLGTAQMRVAGRGLGWASVGSPWGPSWEAEGNQAGTGSRRTEAEALARWGWGCPPACLQAGSVVSDSLRPHGL